MDQYIISITIIGLAALGMAWIPSLTQKINISYSIIFLAFGIISYSLLDDLPWPNPLWQEDYAVHLTELVVIIALMGTGIKIDRPFSFSTWKIPLRLVTVTMLLSIGILSCLGIWVLDFSPASAILLGAVLAPTDPVLASDVQVGPPNTEKEHDVHFSLTAEAGLNDGMAFPFTWLAIGLAISGQDGDVLWWVEWFSRDVIFRLLIGALIGFSIGKAIIHLFFRLPEKYKMLHIRDGFVALSATLLVYGLTELLHGYGFIAVFIAAVTIRNFEINHEYHSELHRFTDQIERILLAILLTLFGGSLVNGILNDLTWPMVLLGIGFVLLIRPLTGLVGLIHTPLSLKDKFAISFFGIKGMGSFFYVAFAMSKVQFENEKEIWSLTAFVVLLSILMHGLTATYAMKRLKLQNLREQTPKVA